MDRRLELHNILLEINGGKNVYFQPPESLKMNYPAIRYKRDDIKNTFADDLIYKQAIAYKITVIDSDPDSELVKKISQLPKVRWISNYAANGLNHDVFTIYY